MKTSTIPRIQSIATILAVIGLSSLALPENAVADPAKPDPPAKPAFSGKFVGDGKPAVIKHVTVNERKGFGGKQALTLIFTEKDPKHAENLESDAFFKRFGSALILSVHYDGEIFGCEVAHTAHTKTAFSSSGRIRMKEFEIAGGRITGHATTDGIVDSLDQKWEVDLKFALPLPEKLRAASGDAQKPVANGPPSKPSTPREMPGGSAKIASRTISVRDLPLPKDATDVHYKALVNQILLSSGQSVAAVTSELSAGLKKQGWKDGVGSLQGPKNAILKREMGEAKLTIMIQPAQSGSTVKIFTNGLDWSGTETRNPSATNKSE